MKEYDELPIEKKLPWPHSQQDFVTIVLSLGGHLPNEDDLDALGQRMLNMVDLDPSPFPDFQSMRLALQHGCDVATHEAMLNETLQQYSGAITALNEAGIGFAKPEAGEAQGADTSLEQLQDIMHLNSELALGAMGGPPRQFVRLPAPGAKLTWNDSLHAFVALVVTTDRRRIVDGEIEEDSLESTAERYRSFIDVDYAGYRDFQALLQAYPPKTDPNIFLEKLFRIQKAHDRLIDAGPSISYKRYTGFAVQADYHSVVADEVSRHWPAINRNKLVYLLDVLFMPNKFIKQVLKAKEE